MSKKDRNKLISTIGLLIAVIVLLALTIRFLGGSETLSEYAKDHPEEQVGPQITPIAEDAKDKVNPTTSAEVESAAGSQQIDNVKESVSKTEPDAGSDKEDVTNAPAQEGSTTGDQAGGAAGSEITQFDDVETPERVTYAEGFYYEPIPQVIRDKMKGVSYPLDIDENRVNYDMLRYVRLKYIDFDGNEAEGEMVCNAAIAQDVVEIFHELYLQGYRIESIRLIDDYDADDTASMLDNNTSCFCYRTVEGSTHLSNHAYGRAIDLNPFYNPYIVFGKGENGGDYISPEGSEIYVDRTADFPHKIDENDLAFRLFKQHGFKWGGDWNTMKDYQHFEKKA